MDSIIDTPESSWGILTRIFWLNDEEFSLLKKGLDLIPDILRVRTLTSDEITAYQIVPTYDHKFYVILEALPNDSYDPFTLFTKALLAFRLHRTDWVFLDGIYLFSLPGLGSHRIRHLPGPEIRYSYRLSTVDVKVIGALLSKILTIDMDKNLAFKIACERYERSSYDVFVGDQIIDCCIGYEALFLKGESLRTNMGMGRVIGLACSMLLGEDETERSDISSLIQTTFSIRNRIVHGAHVEANEMIRVHSQFREYLRRAILQLMPCARVIDVQR